MTDRYATLKKLTVTALGSGYLPVAPGTWGSALAAVIALLLPLSSLWLLPFGALLFCVGVAVCPWAEAHYGRKVPRPFVLDEVVGMWFTMGLSSGLAGILWPQALSLPVFSLTVGTVMAFLAFRIFDVVKPWPIRHIEKLHAGWGVMLDDVGAAVYAAALLWMAAFALQALFPAAAAQFGPELTAEGNAAVFSLGGWAGWI